MLQAEDGTIEKKMRRFGPTGRPTAGGAMYGMGTGAPAGGGAVYGLGMIGALVYFFGSAASGRDRLLVIPKASVWPALLVYKLLKSFYG